MATNEQSRQKTDFLRTLLLTRDMNMLREAYKGLVHTMCDTYPVLKNRDEGSRYNLECRSDLDKLTNDPIAMRFVILVSLATVHGFFAYTCDQAIDARQVDVLRQRLTTGIRDLIFGNTANGTPVDCEDDLAFRNHMEFLAEFGPMYCMNAACTFGPEYQVGAPAPAVEETVSFASLTRDSFHTKTHHHVSFRGKKETTDGKV